MTALLLSLLLLAAQASANPDPAADADDDPAGFLLPGSDLATVRSTLERCLGQEIGTRAERPAGSDAEAWHLTWNCQRAAEALAEREPDHRTVWDLHDGLPMAAPLRGALVSGLLAGRLREVSEASAPLAGGAPRGLLALPAIQPAKPPAREPGWIGQAAPEVALAWRGAWSARQHWFDILRALAGEHPRSFLAESSAFFESIAAYLRGTDSPAEAVARIGSFAWGSWCGTGSDALRTPQDTALTLAFLDLGALDQARAGVVAQLRARGMVGVDPGSRQDWTHLADRLGVDWEALAVAALLDGDGGSAELLGRLGSEHGARLLLASARPDPDPASDRPDQLAVLAALAALVEPGSACPAPPGLSSLDLPARQQPLPGDVQLDALELMAGLGEPPAGLEQASEAARQLRRLCRPESLPAFEVMAGSRYSAVRQPAQEALRALGVRRPVPRRTPALTVRLVVDEQPWIAPVTTVLQRGGGFVESTQDANRRGEIVLDRDPFLDTRRPVSFVSLRAARLEQSTTWFAVELPAADVLGGAARFATATTTVQVTFPVARAGACAADTCQMRLEAELPYDFEPGVRAFQEILPERPVKPGTALGFRLQRDHRYRAVVQAGPLRWASPAFVLTAEPRLLELAGDDLRPPGDWTSDTGTNMDDLEAP
jgi:hypothetical protein